MGEFIPSGWSCENCVKCVGFVFTDLPIYQPLSGSGYVPLVRSGRGFRAFLV